jgi:hypothetical protein
MDFQLFKVVYEFWITLRECNPSDVPEEAVQRLAFPLSLSVQKEDSETSRRLYLIQAEVRAESKERAIEIVHRYFAHVPGCDVVSVDASPVPSADHPDLFAGDAAPGRTVECTFEVILPASDVGPYWERMFPKIRMEIRENLGGSCICAAWPVVTEGGDETETVERAWTMIQGPAPMVRRSVTLL